ncbi:signal peptidase I [Chloroflexota bacterium]
MSGIAKREVIKRFGKYIRYTGITLVVLLLLLSLALLFAPRLGWQIEPVLSGSMSPAMGTGSAVVSRPVDPDAIELGDIITYHSPRNGELTTHRVVGIEENSPLSFRTKGDANEGSDPYMVPSADIEGRVLFDMPLLGYVASFIRSPLGFILMLGLPGMVVIMTQMRKMWIELSEEEREKVKVNGNV